MAKLVCTLEISKESGVTITVENAEHGVTQTLRMDGTALQLEVAGGEDKSTFTQTAGAIKIECKDFSVVARNSIACTSEQGPTVHKAQQGAFDIVAERGDLSFTSGASVRANADEDLEIAAANVKASARTGARWEAPQTSISGQTVTVEGSANLGLSGAQVAVKADAQLSAESSGMATVGGNMTTIKGALIRAG